MKKYIPRPGVPKPVPVVSPDSGKKKAPIRKNAPEPTPKPDKKKKRGADKVGNVFIPDFSKPKGNRLKFLNQLSEMNKKKR
jgi:hypothetical protein